ncbi:HalOD1 output domain-containing protein [Halorussus caseinilyticus]|uniref:HalOD1 output domain-containing protein n=1 Tax=Halorussus caseinilyticus TaxID=3034025 RepID=UPI0023E8CBEF|nr:HalOD1 output domain-containing protein [Halorussus sp. DT72]
MDSEDDAYRTTFDSSTPPSIAVVEALSTVTGEGPTEVGPLYSAIDPDALDALFRGAGETPGDGRVTFVLDGHAVTVRRSGVVEVRDADE